MNRGFLNNPTRRMNNRGRDKASANPTGTTGSTPSRDVQIVELNLYNGDPNNFSLSLCTAQTVQLPLHWALTPIHPKALILSTISSTVPGDSNKTCCILYARTKHRLSTLPPNLPCMPMDSSNILCPPYEIRSAGPKKLGMFATTPLKIGDLILVEMPLIVLPIHTDLSGVKCPDIMHDQAREYREKGLSYAIALELMLNVAFTFGKMRKQHQDAYLALDRSFWSDLAPPEFVLSSIWRTNGFEFNGLDMGEDEDKYCAVLKDASRINHSCRPNCAHSFSPDSFTLEFRATREIEAGEEIVYSICDPCKPTSWRQEYLKDQHGFTCTCLSCAINPDPRSDAIRVSIPGRVNALSKAWREIWNLTRYEDEGCDMYNEAVKIYETSSSLVRDMEQVGLDGYGLYPRALKICSHAYSMLSSLAKSRGFEAEVRRWEGEGSRITEKAVMCVLASDGSYKTRKKREREDRDGPGLEFLLENF